MNMKQSLVNNQTKHNNIRLSLNYRVKNTPEINSAISLSRILGMVFIVLCHIMKYFEFVPMHESLAQFFNCGVDLFLFISGYLYGGKIVSNFKRWFTKRIIAIVIPSVLVSIIVIIALFFANEYTSINSIIVYCLDLEGLLFINGHFSAFFNNIESLGPLWFTTIIMFCYLLVPLLQMMSRKIKIKKFIVPFIILGSVFSVATSTFFYTFYFYIFAVGYFLGNTQFMKNVKTKFFLIHSGAFVCALIGRLLLQRMIDGTFLYNSYVSLSQFIVGTWFVTLFAFLMNINPCMIERICKAKITRTIDGYSFYVYLVHGIFCVGVFNIFNKIGLIEATFAFLALTIFCAFITKIVCKLLQKHFLHF